MAAAATSLHQVVDHDVAQRAHRVVEVPAVVHAELLGHGDLDTLDVVPVPDRLEDGVGEAEVEDLLEPHLAQVVVDAAQLRLVDVLVQVGCERGRRRDVVPERLLHDDPAAGRQLRLGEALHHRAEQERWDLEVVDGVRGALDRRADAGVGARVGEVALHVRQSIGEPGEHLRVELLAGADDRVVRARDQLLHRPVVDGDADDRAAQQTLPLEPVERAEGHDACQVAGDPEDDEHVGGMLLRLVRRRPVGRRGVRCGCHRSSVRRCAHLGSQPASAAPYLTPDG